MTNTNRPIPMHRLTPKFIERFKAKVHQGKEGECSPWTGANVADGYGRVKIDGKMFQAHRVAWAIAHGRDPGKLMVRHKTCAYKSCCDPQHLRVGTSKDNAADTKADGHKAGQKIDNKAARRMWLLHKTGRYSQRHLSSLFSVGQPTVSDTLARVEKQLTPEEREHLLRIAQAPRRQVPGYRPFRQAVEDTGRRMAAEFWGQPLDELDEAFIGGYVTYGQPPTATTQTPFSPEVARLIEVAA